MIKEEKNTKILVPKVVTGACKKLNDGRKGRINTRISKAEHLNFKYKCRVIKPHGVKKATKEYGTYAKCLVCQETLQRAWEVRKGRSRCNCEITVTKI